MEKSTLIALKKSIKHWEDNVKAETVDQASISSWDCALCRAFEGCEGCPVMESTGDPQCDGTPYHFARIKFFDWRRGGDIKLEEWRRAAQKELDFLRSLLPNETQP